jgi:hypothetical protein
MPFTLDLTRRGRRQLTLVCRLSLVAEGREGHLFDGRVVGEETGDGADGDARGPVEGEAVDAGADRREGDRAQVVVDGDLE